MREARTVNHSVNSAGTSNHTTSLTHTSNTLTKPNTNSTSTSGVNSFVPSTMHGRNYLNAQPLMSSIVAPPLVNSNINHLSQFPMQSPQLSFSQQSATSSPTPSALSVPIRGTNSNIGDRLLRLSQSTPEQDKMNKLRDTLAIKFRDILECLQGW